MDRDGRSSKAEGYQIGDLVAVIDLAAFRAAGEVFAGGVDKGERWGNGRLEGHPCVVFRPRKRIERSYLRSRLAYYMTILGLTILIRL